MNWEMISAVGQMLGAVGVIISIIYLAAQIRNQNKESQRAAMNVLTTHWSDFQNNFSLVERWILRANIYFSPDHARRAVPNPQLHQWRID